MHRAKVKLTYEAVARLFGLPEGVEVEAVFEEPQRRMITFVLSGPEGTIGFHEIREGCEIPQIGLESTQGLQPGELYSQYLVEREERDEQDRQRRENGWRNAPF